jgi:hypothetical protein
LRGESSAATALYLDSNLQKTFVVVRIMASASYLTAAFKDLNSLYLFVRVVDSGS